MMKKVDRTKIVLSVLATFSLIGISNFPGTVNAEEKNKFEFGIYSSGTRWLYTGNENGGKLNIANGTSEFIPNISEDNKDESFIGFAGLAVKAEKGGLYSGGYVDISGGDIINQEIYGNSRYEDTSIAGAYIAYDKDSQGETVNGFNNTVKVTGGKFDRNDIIGACLYITSNIEDNVNFNLKNNTVLFDGVNRETGETGRIGSLYGAQILFASGADCHGGVIDNSRVIIKNSNLKLDNEVFYASMVGGWNDSHESQVKNCLVEINNSSIGYESYKYQDYFIVGGYGKNCEGNKVNLIDAELRKNYYPSNNNRIYGAVIYNGLNAINNSVMIDGNTDISVAGPLVIAGAYISSKEEERKAIENSVILKDSEQGTNIEKADLYGYYDFYTVADIDSSEINKNNVRDNNLIVDNWIGTVNSVQYFDNIEFKNIRWNDKEKVLIIKNNKKDKLKDTNINNITISSDSIVTVGESMTLIHSVNSLGNIKDLENGKEFNTIVGVATAVDGIIEQPDANNITATIKDVKLADQTKLVASNRAVAAAFVNQGTDLIADSLDTLSRDGKYGVKTFAAVHGNRSKYDVNSDIKINGWSTIVGVGAENEHNGGDFSWGVFYENGSGNYRTFNSFNNEFFRSDGSLVYNGGGIAARYENSHGVYTEGSLRAGMLKSEMTDALSDGENKYGYESETAYYGAHIGVGKIFSLGDDSDLDVYGKFFHTYTEGDSFKVANDEFEFDSINSDRLRIGARVTSNKENKFSTYYGLAYEYEFNGDAEMRAAGMKAPTQSLQGSSVMAEIGLNYQPTPDSPWSFDLNMRGYAGERQGGSFNVQATYTF